MIVSTEFQTPSNVCEFMASFVDYGHILEPTPGIGNLVESLKKVGHVTTPHNDFWDYYELAKKEEWKFDSVVMNPPFTPVIEGYRYLTACMELSDKIVALLPWLILINSEKRMKNLMSFGLTHVIHLPRKTFPKSRIQCCIVVLQKGHSCSTIFDHFTW